MKSNKTIVWLFLLTFLYTGMLCAQNKSEGKKPQAKEEKKPLRYKVCNPPVDTDNTHMVSLADAVKWAESQPLEVLCDGKTTVQLYQFQIQIISKEPLATVDYGIGEAGIPILAVNAIKNAKPGDTVFLKNVTFKDRTTREVLKSPNIVFTIK